MSFTVAIVGRPNVGKSTLFNRLVGKKLALVDDLPGVTRDRREGQATLGDLEFEIIDTAGLEESQEGSLESRMRAQTEQAVLQADAILFLIDARTGITPDDSYFANLLRKAMAPVILIGNKTEGKKAHAGLLEAYELGLGEPMAMSAEHGEGMADLYDALLPFEALATGDDTDDDDALESQGAIPENVSIEELEAALQNEADYDENRPLRIAIVGRPNAGKSTLINAMLGEDRMLTGPEAGITRDSISVNWTWKDRKVKLFDTAGIRRKARVNGKLEKLSVADALRAIRFAEVVILMLDSQSSFEAQDLHIADLVIREGRSLIIAVNKWDLVEDPNAERARLDEMVERLLPQIRGTRLVTLSGLHGRGIDKLMKAASDIVGTWSRRISTSQVNKWLDRAIAQHNPPAVSGRRIRIRYGTQAKTRPPHFVVFCSRPEVLPESYKRYLVNSLRDHFKLPAIPIRMTMRKGDNPYASKAKKR